MAGVEGDVVAVKLPDAPLPARSVVPSQPSKSSEKIILASVDAVMAKHAIATTARVKKVLFLVFIIELLECECYLREKLL